MSNRRYLEIAERLSLLGSVAGSVASVVSQQILFASVPLSLAVLLNLINRSRFEQWMGTQIDQRLSSLQQQITALPAASDAVDLKELEKRLASLSAKIVDASTQIETAVRCQTHQAAEFKLVDGPDESREYLELALRTADKELILVSPWLRKPIIDELIPAIEEAIARGVHIKIGWGYAGDLGSIITLTSGGASIYNRSWDKQESYAALPYLRQLRDKHPGNLTLKLLGTHEKFLVCDRSFALLGSHNLLSSGRDGRQREVGMLATSQEIIQGLIDRFEHAPRLEYSISEAA